MIVSGGLLIRDVEVQAAACRDRVNERLQLRGRGRVRPGGPPALQRDPRGQPGAHGPDRRDAHRHDPRKRSAATNSSESAAMKTETSGTENTTKYRLTDRNL